MKKFNSLLIKLSLLFVALFSVLGYSLRAMAKEIPTNGKWEVDITKNLPMGANLFSDTAIIEKLGDDHYLTITVLDNSSIPSLRLIKGDDIVGEIKREEGNKTLYTYTVSKNDLNEKLLFNAFIQAMQTNKEFNIELKMDTMRKLSDEIEDLGERPALFLPRLSVSAGNSEMNLGSYYQIVPATATLHSENVNVKISVYYMKDGVRVPVLFEGFRFMLEEIGEYHVIYRAESDKYSTSIGNKTYSEVDIKIISKVNATSLAKVNNIEGSDILPKNINVQASLLDDTSALYNEVKDKLINISNNFQVIDVNLFDNQGDEFKPAGEIELYLYASPSFDRTKIEVYRIDGGELIKIANENYGRYVKLNVSDTGSYVILVPGVPFVMPMWGYATITIAGAVLLIGGITAAIIIVRRKRKKRVEA